MLLNCQDAKHCSEILIKTLVRMLLHYLGALSWMAMLRAEHSFRGLSESCFMFPNVSHGNGHKWGYVERR